MNSMRLKLTVLFGAFIGCVDLEQVIPTTVQVASGQTKMIFLQDKFTWVEANFACRLLDAELATVDSQIISDQMETFSTTVWKGWDHAWIGLHWSPQTDGPDPQLTWIDTCRTLDLNEDWVNFKSNEDFKDSELCYWLDKDLTWERKNCETDAYAVCAKTVYDVSSMPTYERIDSGFVAVNVSTGTQPDVECKELCDKVMGCYMTSPHGPGCIMSIVQSGAETYFKVSDFDLTSETHIFDEDSLDEISDQASKISSLDTPCEVQPRGNTGDFIDVSTLDPLDMYPVSTETVTHTVTVQTAPCVVDLNPLLQGDSCATVTVTETETETPSCDLTQVTTSVTGVLSCEINHETTAVTNTLSCDLTRVTTTVSDAPACEIMQTTTTVTDTLPCDLTQVTTTVSDAPSCEIMQATTTVTDTLSYDLTQSATMVTDTLPTIFIQTAASLTDTSPFAIIQATPTVIDTPPCATTTVTDTPSPAPILRTTMTETTTVMPSCSSEVTSLFLNTSPSGLNSEHHSGNISEKEKEAIESSIVKHLKIDTRSTSKFLARYSSAPDGRVSTRAMGYVSMIFLCVTLFLILIIDTPSLYAHVKKRLNREDFV